MDLILIDDFKDKARNKDAMMRLAEAVERAINESEGLVETDILGENNNE